MLKAKALTHAGRFRGNSESCLHGTLISSLPAVVGAFSIARAIQPSGRVSFCRIRANPEQSQHGRGLYISALRFRPGAFQGRPLNRPDSKIRAYVLSAL